MPLSLGLVLANIIMTKKEKAIVDNLVKEGTIKFYVHYVDDTLLLVKHQDLNKVLKAFNRFDKNLKCNTDNSRMKHHNGLNFFEKTSTLDSTLT